MNSIINEMKNTLERVTSRRTEAEQIRDLEDRMVEIIATKQNKKEEWKEMKTD